MSITAIQMITDAFRKANIIDQIQAPGAEQAASGLRMLNQMLADWEADGIRLGWYSVTDQQTTLPLEEQDERGVLFNLAVEIAGDYGIAPSVEVARIADETFARFAKASLQDVQADLTGLPCEDAGSSVTWSM